MKEFITDVLKQLNISLCEETIDVITEYYETEVAEKLAEDFSLLQRLACMCRKENL